jgi:hypothetical protein
MGTSFQLYDAGFGATAAEWPHVWRATLECLNIPFQVLLTADGESAIISFSKDFTQGMYFSTNPTNGHLQIPWDCVSLDVCNVLFHLANDAKLFLLVTDGPAFLRPLSLQDRDFDRGPLTMTDVANGAAVHRFLFAQQDF